MQEIELTQNKYAIIDDEDFERVNQFKWYANYSNGYWRAVRHIKKDTGKRASQLMHRFIMNTSKGMDTDHKNHNGLDNRKSNLRICTHAENMMNQLPRKRKITSEYKGVYWDRECKKWRTRIIPNNKHLHLGYFVNEITAAKMYDRKAKELFGEFACLNFG